MPYCKECGTQIPEEAEFCPKCGTSVAEYKWEEMRDQCFGWGKAGAPWGIVSIGVFIIGLAILWYYNLFWPGILFLIGIMIIIGAIISYMRRRPRMGSPPSR